MGPMKNSRAWLGYAEAKFLLAMFGAFFLFGCQSALLNYQGGMVARDNQIPILEAGEHSGTWMARDLAVDYKYLREGDQLKISGKVRYEDLIKYNFLLIKYFHLDGILVDSHGNVLEIRGLTSDMQSKSEDPVPFSTVVKLPPGTVAMAFSYRGKAEDAGHDGSSTYFWKYPIY